jgi:succinate dehydrogenase/fumarate reductase cytochrome b subunit
MNATLARAILVAVPVCVLFFYSALAFRRAKSLGSSLQLFGAACLVVVILSHVCEALRIVPWMRWGAKHSAGHYLDLSSAILGLASFPLGYLLQTLERRRI